VRAALDMVPGLLVVDEAYGQFAATSALDLIDDDRPLVVTRTFSKTWSLAAARLGYLVGPRWLVAELDKVTLPYHLDAAKQIAGRLALRYVAVFAERHIQLVSGTAEQRLARTLSRLGTQSGIPTATGVDVAITNELLAALSDVSRFTASRTLGSWSREGAVRKSRGHVYITSPEKLLID
jgi:histidinol-phosphate/aromatic aminotransferase/cobyric acid decarboxylase-like protein